MLEKIFPKEGQAVPEIRFKGFEGDWKKSELENLADFFKGKGLSKNVVSSKVPGEKVDQLSPYRKVVGIHSIVERST